MPSLSKAFSKKSAQRALFSLSTSLRTSRVGRKCPCECSSKKILSICQGEKILRKVLIGILQLFRQIRSRFFPQRSCRFFPTCSGYAREVLQREPSLWRALFLIVCRVVKCGPWHCGGWDPYLPRAEDQADAEDFCRSVRKN